MSIDDATPADWDRLRQQSPAIEKKATGLDVWMRAAHDEASEAWEEDVVNKPSHYNTGNIECIDAIEESMSSVAFKGYLKGNCMKYLWRYDYNNVRPHSSLGNQTPAEARRALEQFESAAHDALAQTDDEEYENQTRKLSL